MIESNERSMQPWAGHNLPESVQKRWQELQAKGEFNEATAFAVMLPLNQQYNLGKSLEMVWDNRMQLPCIQDEIKYLGESSAVMKVMDLLNGLNRLAVGKNSLSDEGGIKELAEMIVEDMALRKWKLTEFKVITTMAIRGEFGTIYDRVDASVVYEWIRKYEVDRHRKIQAEREKEQSQHNGPIHPEVAGKLAGMFKQFAKPEPERTTQKRYGTVKDFIEANPLIVQQWETDYDDRIKSGMPTKMDKRDYIAFKAAQTINP